MPRISQQALAQQIDYLKQRYKKLTNEERYRQAERVAQNLLFLNPSDGKLMEKYIQTIKQTNNKQKVYRVYQSLIKNDKNNLDIYKQYIEQLIDDEQYDRVKVVIKNAIKIDDSQPSLYIKFAKVSHRSKTFHDGLQILEQYQRKYQNQYKTNEKVLLWRVYLSYQIARYEDAYNFSDIILKLPDLSAQDFDYYMIQKCKYCVLLGKYEESIKIGSILLQKLAVHQKNKLKVHALKAFCHYKINKINQIMPIMKSAISFSPNDEMINFKWCLLKLLIYQLPKNQDQRKNKKDDLIQITIKMTFFLNKVEQCNEQIFQKTKLSDHFNWYSQLRDYYTHVKFLQDSLSNIDDIIDLIKKIALNLFLSLLQGYEDCQRTNILLIQISNQIRRRLNQKRANQK